MLTYEEYKPGSKVREEEQHPADICGYVIEGVLTIESEGRGIFEAHKGDAFYLRARLRHISSNKGTRTLRLVSVQPR